MRTIRHLLVAVAVCILSGCASSPQRIVSLRDSEQHRPVANKTLIFAHSRESWYPGAAVPLFGPAVETLEVPLDTNGEARVRLRSVSWWARVDMDGTRTGNCGTSIKPSDVRDGGTFRLYRPPPVVGDTNIFASQYVLTITKP